VPRADVIIVGGGIVGLATALALIERHPATRLVVLDKEARLAAHQSGHNSGVIHSGIYYRPGSYKARLCAEGRRLMYEFCRRHGIVHERCGKVVVATDERELPGLETIHERGRANGVEGLRMCSGEEIRELEPHCRAIRALVVPETGIVDYVQVAETMAKLVSEQGGEIVPSARVTGVRRAGGTLVVESTARAIETRHVINCAGLHSDRIARMMGLRPEVQIIPFRGEYYMIRPERRHLVRNLIYPVPDPAFPFLGVHFTRTIHGEVEAGPNAVLAFAREGYRMATVNVGEALGTFAYRGFWNMAWRYWRMGSYEFWRSLSPGAFVRSLQRLVPAIRPDDVTPGGAGVRAQAVGRDGSLVDDFAIAAAEGAIHVLNAPSPGATSSLAIGRHIAGLAAETFSLGR
jgi:L-2-hydroxyglutarate oxidase LhgO